MRRIPQGIYDRIDNAVYDAESGHWWQADSAFYQLKVAFNPARVGYAKRIVRDRLRLDPRVTPALDVGCGGGFVTEEVARMGFDTTGVDPSEPSLRAAAGHASESGLGIRFTRGAAESLPFDDQTFGAVFCCDVLEHVRDLPRAVSEIARVLRPGGVFCYDTINRTWLSYLAAIKVSQEWRRWAFMPPGLHVWRMFIRPREMRALLRENGMDWREHRGLVPNGPALRVLRDLRLRALGRLSYSELAARVQMVESPFRAVMYMGYAVKENGPGPSAA